MVMLNESSTAIVIQYICHEEVHVEGLITKKCIATGVLVIQSNPITP